MRHLNNALIATQKILFSVEFIRCNVLKDTHKHQAGNSHIT